MVEIVVTVVAVTVVVVTVVVVKAIVSITLAIVFTRIESIIIIIIK